MTGRPHHQVTEALLRVRDADRTASPYPALRRLTAELGAGQPMITDQPRLRNLLELTAAADPRLFHVMFLHHCMTLGPALDYGAHPADLDALATGSFVGAALMTELGRGNSSAAIRTEAVLDRAGGEFVLHSPEPGAAKYPPNVGEPGVPRLAVVSARLRVDGTDRGVFLFLVELRDAHATAPGVTIRRHPPTALLPLDYATVRFDRVRIPGHRWLADGAALTPDGGFHDPAGGAGERTRRSLGMSRFAWGAVTVGLAAAARAAVSIALPHALRRITADRNGGERTALDHRDQQRLLFGAAADAYTATVLARQVTAACWDIPAGGGRGRGPSPEVMSTLALTKAAVDLLADRAVARCRSATGALGFFSENRLVDYQALTAAFHSAGGDNRLIMLDAARSLAAQPAPPAGLAHLRDEDGLGALFRTHERTLHEDLTERLARAAADGADPADAWDDQSALAGALARAHVTRTAAETALPRQADDPVAADLLRAARLDRVVSDPAGYLMSGLATADQVTSWSVALDGIHDRLRPLAARVVDLMAVPPALLDSPLARPDYIAALSGE
ncbi:acyl-CoA dehydrogenase [Kitasatospora sp. NPDC057965]|uniref:acyl-CoA dehydrogenase family protein n=1 Tax=Kitasatospora sp. NPDC057965 TaxID=3346291 RepID=UPI0036DBF081